MKTLNLALVTFAIVSTLSTAAFAHAEFRDRDGLQASQGATASYGQDNSSQVSSGLPFDQAYGLSDAERVTFLKNELKDYNK